MVAQMRRAGRQVNRAASFVIPVAAMVVGCTPANTDCLRNDASCNPVLFLLRPPPICTRTYAQVIQPENAAAVRNELAAQAALGASGTATATTFGSVTGYAGGVLAPNGRIYLIPYSATQVAVIDPNARSVGVIGGALGGGGGRYAGGVLAANGKIYGFPYNNSTFLQIDPATDTVTELGTLPGANKWAGGVAAPNGRLYGTQGFVGTALVIDPSGPSASTVQGTGVGSPGHVYEGAVLGLDGNAYWFPAEGLTSAFAFLDTTTETPTRFGSNSTGAYFSGALAPNGRIYAMPSAGGALAEIDTDSRTVTRFGSVTTSYVGAALAASGRIYSVSNAGTKFLELEAGDQSLTERDTAGSTGWQGAVLALNGKIYGIPLTGTNILEIDTKSNGSLCSAITLSGYLNKF